MGRKSQISDIKGGVSKMNSVLIDRPLSPDGEGAVESGNETWTMIFVLRGELPDDVRGEVLACLDLKAAFVQRVGEPLALSVGVTGPMDEAIAIATSAVVDALRDAAGRSVEIVEARMVGHRDAARQLVEQRPITFYGVTECAKALGVTRQRVGQLLHEDKLPRPDAVVGGKPVWEAGAFERFASKRDRLIRRTPRGRDPRKFDDAPDAEEQ